MGVVDLIEADKGFKSEEKTCTSKLHIKKTRKLNEDPKKKGKINAGNNL